MKRDRLLEVLVDWNFWERKPETGISRPEYLERMAALERTGQVVSLVGVRRSGKSTLIRQYIARLIERGLDSRDTLYINFEDPRFAGELSLALLQDAYEAFLENRRSAHKPYLFLDEVQHVQGWEKFVRALHEREEANLFVSGSSSKLLSAEFGSALTGRHVPLTVHPLSFREFLLFRGLAPRDAVGVAASRVRVRQLLREYLEFGGFPRVVLGPEKSELLATYLNDVLTRDVAERHHVRKVEKLRELAKYYFTNTSSLASYHRIKTSLGISLDTVERLSHYLEEAYLVHFVRKFAYSLREQEVNPRKVYAVDTGLRNATGFRFSEDAGRLYENLAYLELKRRGKEVYYHKDRKECDFVVREGTRVTGAVQVSYDLDDHRTRQRELDGLLKALKQHHLSKGLVLTQDHEGEERLKGKRITYTPLWKWLLTA